MQYRVCILAAGRGSRLSSWQTIHKALLPVGNQAVISRIIEKFPKDVEFVIPCGYKSDQLRDFIEIAHPDRHITLVDVDKWEGKGSGPGYSLLACKDHLQGPFIFTGADTLVTESVPEPATDWIGVAPVTDTKPYLIAEVEGGYVREFHDKVDLKIMSAKPRKIDALLQSAFIGLAGVHSWEIFWETLAHSQKHLVNDEVQVANGLYGLISHGMTTMSFTWYDTGDDENYRETNKQFTQIVAPKTDEHLYIQNGQVIKFFANEEIAANRVSRAKTLEGVVPPITKHLHQFYAYKKVPGEILSHIHDAPAFSRFLEFCHTNLWQPMALDKKTAADFISRCDKFYKVKTEQRVSKYLSDAGEEDTAHTINGHRVPTLKEMFAQVDWNYLAQGTPVRFHGDPQPENIIVTPTGQFTLIDWRQDFAGLLEYGDLYYDLAKLDHALLVNGEMIRQENFEVHTNYDDITFEFHARSHLL